MASGIWGVIGVGVGALLRNQVAAVVGIVLYRFLIEGILSAIPKVQNAYPYLPGGATASLLQGQDTGNGAPFTLLSPWVGGLPPARVRADLRDPRLDADRPPRRDLTGRDADRDRALARCAHHAGRRPVSASATLRPSRTVTWLGSTTHRGRGDRRRVHAECPQRLRTQRLACRGDVRAVPGRSWQRRHRLARVLRRLLPGQGRARPARPPTSGRCCRSAATGRLRRSPAADAEASATAAPPKTTPAPNGARPPPRHHRRDGRNRHQPGHPGRKPRRNARRGPRPAPAPAPARLAPARAPTAGQAAPPPATGAARPPAAPPVAAPRAARRRAARQVAARPRRVAPPTAGRPAPRARDRRSAERAGAAR